MNDHSFDAQLVREWFLKQKRKLPWRDNPSPYAVWISEIMLQQTQVSVATEYFLRWMHRFPTVRALGAASQEEVLKMWEGLGYYSRARHVHSAACYFLEKHGGEIPSTREELKKVKGLGPYTIGAILSFAFHQRAPAVDANVARVLARYFCIEEEIALSSVQKRIWQIAESILPEQEPWVVVEGLIELGAIVCMPKPKCTLCPLNGGCVAFHKDKQTSLPLKKKRNEITPIKRTVFVIVYETQVLLKKGATRGIMAGLYEFPYCEEGKQPSFPFPLLFEKKLAEEHHSFTRYRAHLFPSLWKALEKREMEEYIWVDWEKMRALPFSSGHRRIADNLFREDAPTTY